ncbi:MAG: lysophospholipid acyltransferase family protein [candidate division WOR-3 bacterium]
MTNVLPFRLLLLSYLLIQKEVRQEIRKNFSSLLGRDDPHFWLKNAWRLGENFARMWQRNWRLDRIHLLGDNIKKGEGMIFLTLHFGVWEILPKIFSSLGYRVAIAVSKQRNPFFDKILKRWRQGGGVKMVYRISEMIDLLKRGFLLGFAGDNTHQAKIISLPGFWEGFGIIKTPFVLKERTKAKLYSLFARESKREIIIHLRMVNSPSEFAQVAREYIRTYPEEWIFWGK